MDVLRRLYSLSPSSPSSQTISSQFPSWLPLPPSPMAPGIDFSPAPVAATYESITTSVEEQSPLSSVYYNSRLDPKNYLDGPLSWNPATRLRQMLARPGIVVSLTTRIMFRTHGLLRSANRQVAPGICDGISARCALEAGFTCLYQRFYTSVCVRCSCT